MKFRTFALAAAAVAATLGVVPAVATAQEGDRTTTTERAARTPERAARMDSAKKRCLEAIDRRQKAIVELNNRIEKRTNLPDAHRAALKDIHDKTSRGLAALADTIQGEDNPQELRAECRRIVDDYRVFALLRPRARLVMTSDRELAAVERQRKAADRIQGAIDEAKADKKDTSKAEADLATMRSAIQSAAEHAGAVYEEVIHITAESFTDDALKPGRDDTRAARDALRKANEAGHSAVQELRGSPAGEA